MGMKDSRKKDPGKKDPGKKNPGKKGTGSKNAGAIMSTKDISPKLLQQTASSISFTITSDALISM